jgi:hypothetical protein
MDSKEIVRADDELKFVEAKLTRIKLHQEK